MVNKFLSENWLNLTKKIALAKICIIIFFFIACKESELNVEPPLATIIKLNSAEEIKSFDIAKKYIDVERVYGNKSKGNESAEDIWKNIVTFNNNLGNSKKFTNKFLYHKYDIFEKIDNKKSTVKFKSENQKKLIIYSLEIIDGRWKVVGISIKKN